MLVGFAGNCGTGKSTISREVARHYNGILVLEDEKANPYFSDFITGRKETAFHAELAFLSNKLLDIENANPRKMVVVDRIPEEDVEIFARYWADQGLLNPIDFELYRQVAGQLLRAARSFDVIVYLHGPVDLLVERLRNRRDSAFNERVERMVLALQPLYEEWVERLDAPLIRLPIDEHDLKGSEGKEELARLIEAIERFRFPLFGDQSG
ncbi:MAG: deoxynucleoside kinase [Candidatus Eisenbacteria bacterium]|nr:deoxynucleoside kinase [Candidatus Eisenbacteria bacterium]